jgi:hypothetical protein
MQEQRRSCTRGLSYYRLGRYLIVGFQVEAMLFLLVETSRFHSKSTVAGVYERNRYFHASLLPDSGHADPDNS